MRIILMALFIVLSCSSNAQECEYSIAGTAAQNLKTTKEYLISEKVFGGTSSYIFFSLSTINDVPVLNFKLLSKSKDFPKAYCLDKISKIYFQLSNGKLITLLNAYDEQCASLVYDSNEKNNLRILTGSFYFSQGSLEYLEKYPITIMKVKYSTENVDYTIKKEIKSELNGKVYNPETYFNNFLKCIK